MIVTPVGSAFFSFFNRSSRNTALPSGHHWHHLMTILLPVLAFALLSTSQANAAPRINIVTPQKGPVGMVVVIVGSGFGTTQGSSTVTFNGTPVTWVTWGSTSLQVRVPEGATTGNVVVRVSGTNSNGVTFTVTPSPTINDMSPTSGAVGASLTITGSGFTAGGTQMPQVEFYPQLYVDPTTSSDTSITAAVPPGATTGDVVVSVGGGASNAVLFTVTSSGPSISNVSPSGGTVGTSVTLTGSSFGSSQGNSTVTFNGTSASPTSWTATSIALPVPTGATTGNVIVTVGGVASNAYGFTVGTAAPSITGISPTSGAVGTVTTISGTNFGSSQGSSTVNFNGVTGIPTSWSSTSIKVKVPAGATTGNVVVYAGSTPSNGMAFTVPGTGPSITGTSQTSGPVGSSITITGTNFGQTQGNSTVTFGGVAATATGWSPTSIVAVVPSEAATGNIVVTANSATSNGVSFTVSPYITGLSPTSGIVGSNVLITGTTFGSSPGQVTFTGTTASPSSWNDIAIVVPVPAGATTGNVVVTAGGIASNGVLFKVGPNITGISPNSAAVDSQVTITGTNFGATQGTSTVTFNGTTATPTSWNDTSIATTVPTAASTGNIVVTVGEVASAGVLFTVTRPGGVPQPPHYSKRIGFDTHNVPSKDDLRVWWDKSPFYNIGIYVGGNNYCGQHDLNGHCIARPDPKLWADDWITEAENQGWGFYPIWVGPQAPCVNAPPHAYNLIDTSREGAPATQGAREADAAAAAMAALGLTGSIVFYDMEGYDQSDQDCSGVVKSFLTAWVREMNADGFAATAVYGGPLQTQSDFSKIPNLTQVWVTYPQNPPHATIWGINYLNDMVFDNAQRVHQFLINVGSQTTFWPTYGNVNFGESIDYDIGYSLVAGASGTKNYTWTESSISVPTTPTPIGIAINNVNAGKNRGYYIDDGSVGEIAGRYVSDTTTTNPACAPHGLVCYGGFFEDNGVSTTLALPSQGGGQAVYLSGLNDLHGVVGAYDKNVSPYVIGAFYWNPNTGSVTTFVNPCPDPSIPNGYAALNGINDANLAVGLTCDPNAAFNLYYGLDNFSSPISPASLGVGCNTMWLGMEAFPSLGVNGYNEIVGTYSGGTGVPYGFVMQTEPNHTNPALPVTCTTIAVPGADATYVTAGNNNGQIYGYYRTGCYTGNGCVDHPFLLDNGFYYNFVSDTSGSVFIGTGINDAAQIVGPGFTTAGTVHILNPE